MSDYAQTDAVLRRIKKLADSLGLTLYSLHKELLEQTNSAPTYGNICKFFSDPPKQRPNCEALLVLLAWEGAKTKEQKTKNKTK